MIDRSNRTPALGVTIPTYLINELDRRGDNRSATIRKWLARYTAIIESTYQCLGAGSVQEVINASADISFEDVTESFQSTFANKLERRSVAQAITDQIRNLDFSELLTLIDEIERRRTK